jgi:hypothetical protein
MGVAITVSTESNTYYVISNINYIKKLTFTITFLLCIVVASVGYG